MRHKKGDITLKLGLPTANRLSRAMVREKVRTLNGGLKEGRYEGELREYAVYYRNWYGRKLRLMRTDAKDKKAA